MGKPFWKWPAGEARRIILWFSWACGC